MTRLQKYLGICLMGGILLFSLQGFSKSLREQGEAWENERMEGHEANESSITHQIQVHNNTYQRYKDECGSCHMAYPRQLLPKASWQKLLIGLDNHFGENAELDAQSLSEISTYLTGSANSHDGPHAAQKLKRNLPEALPIRITELPYFVHEHREIPDKMVKLNPKVRSLSQCDSCHKLAEKGYFDEDSVSIPGFSRWDD